MAFTCCFRTLDSVSLITKSSYIMGSKVFQKDDGPGRGTVN